MRKSKFTPEQILQALRQATGALSNRCLALGLNARGIPAPHGGLWSSGQVNKLLRLVDYKPTLGEALALIREELRHRGGHRTRNSQIYKDRLRRADAHIVVQYGLSRERVRQLCYLERRRRKRGRLGPAENETGDVDLRAAVEKLLMENHRCR